MCDKEEPVISIGAKDVLREIYDILRDSCYILDVKLSLKDYTCKGIVYKESLLGNIEFKCGCDYTDYIEYKIEYYGRRVPEYAGGRMYIMDSPVAASLVMSEPFSEEAVESIISVATNRL